MNEDTARKLVEINRQFYEHFSGAFDATRQRVQPGVKRIVGSLPAELNLLDIGCGNGNLARYLIAESKQGAYTGVDFSPGLLQAARGSLPQASPLHITLIPADLSLPGWDDLLNEGKYGIAFCFAVLHHLPGQEQRKIFMALVAAQLQPGGILYLSNWQFLNSPRMAKKILPWAEAGIEPASVDEGDYLLDWHAGGRGLRYVHAFTADELTSLADGAGLRVLDSFLSDGREGNLALYHIMQKERA